MIHRPSCREDLLQIELQSAQQLSDLRQQLLDTEHVDEFLAECCHTLVEGDRIMGVVGITTSSPGVGTCFAYLSKHLTEAPEPLTRHKQGGELTAIVLGLIYRHFREDGLHRMQFTVDARHERGVRWALRLGFQLEGRMRRFGPQQEDHLLFARLA